MQESHSSLKIPFVCRGVGVCVGFFFFALWLGMCTHCKLKWPLWYSAEMERNERKCKRRKKSCSLLPHKCQVCCSVVLDMFTISCIGVLMNIHYHTTTKQWLIPNMWLYDINIRRRGREREESQTKSFPTFHTGSNVNVKYVGRGILGMFTMSCICDVMNINLSTTIALQ